MRTCGLFHLGHVPNDQMGVGIFYHNRRTRRLTATIDASVDLDTRKEKSRCGKCD